MKKVTHTFKQGPSTFFYLYCDGNWCSSAEKYYFDLQAAFQAPKCKMLVKIHNNNYLRYFLFFLGGGNKFFLSFSIFYFDKQIFPFRLSMQICVCTFKSLFLQFLHFKNWLHFKLQIRESISLFFISFAIHILPTSNQK